MFSKYAWLTIVVALLYGCGTNPFRPNIDSEIDTANKAITLIEYNTDAALLAGRITKDQAQSVSAILHQINPLLDAAHAAVTLQDTAGATKAMDLVNSLLAGLSAYIPSTVK